MSISPKIRFMPCQTISWHLTLAPSIIAGEIEKIDTTSTLEGILRPSPLLGLGTGEILIQVKAHAYVIRVKGDNIVLRMEINMTRTDTGEILSDFSGNSTYVFNKFSRENFWAPQRSTKIEQDIASYILWRYPLLELYIPMIMRILIIIYWQYASHSMC